MGKAAILQNQTNIRIYNQVRIIELFKEGPKSCSDLAKILNLSNTAVERIVDELASNNIVELDKNPEGQNKRGRRPDIYKINKDFGVVAGVDLSGRDAIICISDLDNNILARDEVKNVFIYDENIFNEIGEKIKRMLKLDCCEGKKLLNITIASPGKINPTDYSYVYAPRIKDYSKTNLHDFYKKMFGVHVYVYNDVNIGLIGERKYGKSIDNAKNVFFVHIDITAGSALILNNRLYYGANGFAGEINSFNDFDNISTDLNNWRFLTITDVCVETREQANRDPSHPLFNREQVKFEEVCELLESGDPLVTRVVEKIAKYEALQLLCVNNILDLDDLVIEGKILLLGDKFKQMIQKYYVEFDNNHNNAKILFSNITGNAIILGTIYQAINRAFLRQFEKIIVKKSNDSVFKLDEYFHDSI